VREEWDIYPMVPPPYRGPAVLGRGGSKRVLLPSAAEQERYKKRLKEADMQFRRQRVESVKGKITELRNCQSRPAAERRMESFFYLMLCPSLGAYKIGETGAFYQRMDNLRRTLDPQIKCLSRYRTPLHSEMLEQVLHRHFQYFHFPSDRSDEMFQLQQMHADRFEATTAEIEKHQMAIEILHLRTWLSKFEADCEVVG
jgi:hypothetical protein